MIQFSHIMMNQTKLKTTEGHRTTRSTNHTLQLSQFASLCNGLDLGNLWFISPMLLKSWENGVCYSHIKCFVAHGFKFDLAQIMVSFEECARVPNLDIDAKTQSPHAKMMGRCFRKCYDGKVEEMLRCWVEKCWDAEVEEMLTCWIAWMHN